MLLPVPPQLVLRVAQKARDIARTLKDRLLGEQPPAPAAPPTVHDQILRAHPDKILISEMQTDGGLAYVDVATNAIVAIGHPDGTVIFYDEHGAEMGREDPHLQASVLTKTSYEATATPLISSKDHRDGESVRRDAQRFVSEPPRHSQKMVTRRSPPKEQRAPVDHEETRPEPRESAEDAAVVVRRDEPQENSAGESSLVDPPSVASARSSESVPSTPPAVTVVSTEQPSLEDREALVEATPFLALPLRFLSGSALELLRVSLSEVSHRGDDRPVVIRGGTLLVRYGYIADDQSADLQSREVEQPGGSSSVSSPLSGLTSTTRSLVQPPVQRDGVQRAGDDGPLTIDPGPKGLQHDPTRELQHHPQPEAEPSRYSSAVIIRDGERASVVESSLDIVPVPAPSLAALSSGVQTNAATSLSEQPLIADIDPREGASDQPGEDQPHQHDEGKDEADYDEEEDEFTPSGDNVGDK